MVGRGPLPQADYEAIYARVPRLCVEVVIVSPEGVLLARRQSPPCQGLWHLPGGTVRFGEPLTEAVARVARDEVGTQIVVEELLGYIEYPSHLAQGIDWPVGIAFRTHLTPASLAAFRPRADLVEWFRELPDDMHEEQRAFLIGAGLAG